MKKMLLPMLLIGAVISSCGATNQATQNPPITYAKKSLLPAKISTVVDNSVFFPLGSSQVPKTYDKIIRINADYLIKNPKSRISIIALANFSFDTKYNTMIQSRIDNLRDIFIKLGVSNQQINVAIVTQPEDKLPTSTKNQRVDIIYETEAPNFYHYDNKKPTIEMP
jgi:outer membrane protein OmpA-like peptidoglycan-associated protein